MHALELAPLAVSSLSRQPILAHRNRMHFEHAGERSRHRYRSRANAFVILRVRARGVHVADQLAKGSFKIAIGYRFRERIRSRSFAKPQEIKRSRVSHVCVAVDVQAEQWRRKMRTSLLLRVQCSP